MSIPAKIFFGSLFTLCVLFVALNIYLQYHYSNVMVSHFTTALFLAIPALILYTLITLCVQKMLKRKIVFQRHVAIFILFATSGIILFATTTFFLFYNPLRDHSAPNLLPFVSLINNTEKVGIERAVGQWVSNVLMFIPVGLFLPIVFKNMRSFIKTILLISAFVIVIECIQYFIGRSADIDDFIANLCGGIIGFGIYTYLNRKLGEKMWFKKTIGDIQ